MSSLFLCLTELFEQILSDQSFDSSENPWVGVLPPNIEELVVRVDFGNFSHYPWEVLDPHCLCQLLLDARKSNYGNLVRL